MMIDIKMQFENQKWPTVGKLGKLIHNYDLWRGH